MNNLILLPIFLLVLFFLVIWFVWLSQRRGVSSVPSVPGQPRPYFPSPIFRGADDDLSSSLATCSVDMLGPHTDQALCQAGCNPSIPSGRYKLAVTVNNTLYYLTVLERQDAISKRTTFFVYVSGSETAASDRIVWRYDATARTLLQERNQQYIQSWSIHDIDPNVWSNCTIAATADPGWMLTKNNHITWKGKRSLCADLPIYSDNTMRISLRPLTQAATDPKFASVWAFIPVVPPPSGRYEIIQMNQSTLYTIGIRTVAGDPTFGTVTKRYGAYLRSDQVQPVSWVYDADAGTMRTADPILGVHYYWTIADLNIFLRTTPQGRWTLTENNEMIWADPYNVEWTVYPSDPTSSTVITRILRSEVAANPQLQTRWMFTPQ